MFSKSNSASAAILCVLFVAASARPSQLGIYAGSLTTTGTRSCFDVTCPTGSVACSRQMETSDDTRTILTTIKCEDAHGNALHTVSRTSANPHQGVQIHGYSFTGTYGYSSGGSLGFGDGHTNTFDNDRRGTDEVNRNTYYNGGDDERLNDLDDQVETFD